MNDDEENVVLAELYELVSDVDDDWRDSFERDYGDLDSGWTI